MVNIVESFEKAAASGEVPIEMLVSPNLLTITKQESVYLRAAKKVEQQITQMEMEFFKKVHELEAQFQHRYKALTDQRVAVIQGSVPIAEKDVDDVPLIYGLHKVPHEQFINGLKNDPSTKGIPKYWLMALQNNALTSLLIEECDHPILESLKNIDAEVTVEPYGIVLRFYFGPNDYFSNDVIQKFYKFKIEPSKDGPPTFEGPQIESIVSTPIQWKEGKKPAEDSVTFFNNFFNTEGKEEAEMVDDYEIASIIRELIIPHATLYFTGELEDDDAEFEGSCASCEDSDADHEMMEAQ